MERLSRRTNDRVIISMSFEKYLVYLHHTNTQFQIIEAVENSKLERIFSIFIINRKYYTSLIVKRTAYCEKLSKKIRILSS